MAFMHAYALCSLSLHHPKVWSGAFPCNQPIPLTWYRGFFYVCMTASAPVLLFTAAKQAGEEYAKLDLTLEGSW